MNNNKVLALIGLIFLNIVAGYLVFSVVFGGASKFDNTIKKAEDYCKQKLYQKSVEEYDKALMIKSSPKAVIDQLKVYDEGIEFGELTDSYDLETKMDAYIEQYYKDASIYEAVCEFCIKNENYEPCVEYIKQAKSQKVKTEKLDELFEIIRYKYKDEYTMFENVAPEKNESYLVETNGMTAIMGRTNENIVPGLFLWATNFSEIIKIKDEEVRFAVVSKNDKNDKPINYIIDDTGRKQIYIDPEITGAGVIGEAIDGKVTKYVFPAMKGEQYFYYSFDPVTEEVAQLSGPYLFAGAYRNSLAAVKVAENKWHIIDGTGKQVGPDFTDIVLNEATECVPKGLIIASEGEKYQIYKNEDSKPVKVGDFTCDAAKAFVDGTYAAFKQGDKWGFVDDKGKVIIEPEYEDARSFSQGMAAVCVNGMWKFINADNTVVINAEFEDANDFSESGKCFVKHNNYWTSLQLYYVEDKK